MAKVFHLEWHIMVGNKVTYQLFMLTSQKWEFCTPSLTLSLSLSPLKKKKKKNSFYLGIFFKWSFKGGLLVTGSWRDNRWYQVLALFKWASLSIGVSLAVKKLVLATDSGFVPLTRGNSPCISGCSNAFWLAQKKIYIYIYA